MAGLIQTRIQRIAMRDRYPFHMPGHKGMQAWELAHDVTELPGLDNLHNPKGVIALAQARIARVYKVPRTFFLVNGTSIGLMAGLMALTQPGDRVLIERNCHKAIIAGLIHSGAVPVFLKQDFCPRRKIWLPPGLSALKEAIAAGDIKAAVFTNPNYLGHVTNLNAMVACCREHSVRTLVDEAHGAHLIFDPSLPASAVAAGADLVVQSAHKTLSSLTQSAWLHCLDPGLQDSIQQSLNLFHTTSPSYPLLASLELAGVEAQAKGAQNLRRLKTWLSLLRRRCHEVGLECWSHGGRDWTKLIIEARLGAPHLLREGGVYHELTLGRHMLFYTTMADGENPVGLKKLISMLPELAALEPVPTKEFMPPPPLELAISPREAWVRGGRKVPLERAAGEVCCQVLAPYPPGTLIALPGQRLNNETIKYLQMLCNKRVIPGWISVL